MEALWNKSGGYCPPMPEVIASILASDPVDVLRQAQLATMAGADWLEIRLDRLPADCEPRKVLADIRLPVLVACRTPRDGGDYQGSMESRRQILQRWVDADVAGIDLEAWESWVPEGADGLPVVIRSHHNLTGVDENLPAIRDHLLSMGATLAKIAVTAHDLVDAAPVLDLLVTPTRGSSRPWRLPWGRMPGQPGFWPVSMGHGLPTQQSGMAWPLRPGSPV